LFHNDGGVIVGHDHAFENRTGMDYIDFLKSSILILTLISNLNLSVLPAAPAASIANCKPLSPP
jgi:hypothetical protein